MVPPGMQFHGPILSRRLVAGKNHGGDEDPGVDTKASPSFFRARASWWRLLIFALAVGHQAVIAAELGQDFKEALHLSLIHI